MQRRLAVFVGQPRQILTEDFLILSIGRRKTENNLAEKISIPVLFNNITTMDVASAFPELDVFYIRPGL